MLDNVTWELVGEIILIQVQIQRMKWGENPREYLPHKALRGVETITLTPDGIYTMMDDQKVLDVHHVYHKQSRYRQSNGISFGFTSHYEKMRAKFGEHMTLGIAGENMIVKTDRIWTEDDFFHGAMLESPDGVRTTLDGVFAIPPCQPFADFCLNRRDMENRQEAVKNTLQFLFEGIRGFCCELTDHESHDVSLGYTLWVAKAA